MASKLVVLLGLVALCQGGAVIPAAVPAVVPAARLEEFDPAPRYSFAYDVQDTITGDSKAQYETRNGDIVQGSYSLIEADGTRRIVEYTADPINGFNAIVSREPLTAGVAAIASPLVPYAPAAAIPAAPAAIPGAPIPGPAPSIPASGPDSDVEVVEARTGPLRTAPTNEQRLQQQQQFQQFQEQQRQLQQQQLQQLQQLERQQQQARLQIQQQVRQQTRQQQEQQPQEQEQRQQSTTTARTISNQNNPAQGETSQRISGLPTARAITTYNAFPAAYTAYTATYAAPYAYSSLAGLTYAPTAAIL